MVKKKYKNLYNIIQQCLLLPVDIKTLANKYVKVRHV